MTLPKPRDAAQADMFPIGPGEKAGSSSVFGGLVDQTLDNVGKPLSDNVAKPLWNGFAQGANAYANALTGGRLKIAEFEIEPTGQFGELAQGASSAVGALLPYVLAGKLVSKTLRLGGRGLATGMAESLGLAMGAGFVDGFRDLRPGESRQGAILGGLAGFGAFAVGNRFTAALPLRERLGAQALTGLLGAEAQLYVSKKASGQKIDDAEMLRAGINGMAANLVLPLVQHHFEGGMNWAAKKMAGTRKNLSNEIATGADHANEKLGHDVNTIERTGRSTLPETDNAAQTDNVQSGKTVERSLRVVIEPEPGVAAGACWALSDFLEESGVVIDRGRTDTCGETRIEFEVGEQSLDQLGRCLAKASEFGWRANLNDHRGTITTADLLSPATSNWRPKRLAMTVNTDETLAQIVETFPDLQHLDLKGNQITAAGFEHLSRLRDLQHLNLFNTGITDAGLAHLSPLTNLRLLDLSYSGITDAGLAHLSPLTNLQHLDLRCTRTTDAGLAHLSPLTSLQHLHLDSTGVTDAGLAHLNPLTNLQHLDLRCYTRITDAGLAQLSPLTNLQHLNLGSTGITDAGLVHLTPLTNLQHLDLCATRITDAGLAHLNPLTNLQYLDLSNTRISDAGLAHLRPLTNLQHLYLGGGDITDAGLAHLRPLTNLQDLRLWGTGVTDAGLAHLRPLTNLQYLDLRGTAITDAGLAHLSSLTNLQEIVLCRTGVSDAGLAHLSSLTDLQYLDLHFTRVTNAGAASLLAGNPRLSMVH